MRSKGTRLPKNTAVATAASRSGRRGITTFRCLFFTGLLSLITLVYTTLFTQLQPNLQTAIKVQFVDHAARSSKSRPAVPSHEFQILAEALDNAGNSDTETSKNIAARPGLIPLQQKAALGKPNKPQASTASRASSSSSSRPLRPKSSVRPFEMDAFEALRMYASGSAVRVSKSGGESSNSNARKADDSPPRAQKDARKKKEKKIRNRVKEQQGGLPRVAWIMSFGGSGTSYTITNTEQMSNRTTASNYAAGYNPLVPVRPQLAADGPFLRSPHKQLPETFILTKTHCGGYCMQCPPSAYVHTADSFQEACLTGQKDAHGKTIPTTYAADVPEKAVHIIRDPFSNLVGRQHLAMKKRQRLGNDAEEIFASSKEGMQAWCVYLDAKLSTLELRFPALDNDMLSRYYDLPCRTEWFRYIQWHNLAIQATQRLDLPVHVMYYEDYSDNYKATVKDLMQFLELPVVQEPLEFILGKTYASFFERRDAQLAARMVRELATPDAWALLRHYFEGLLDDDSKSVSVTTKRIKEPQVAWLLSFPNSGTSYTITNTEQISNLSTASNYAGGWDSLVPVRRELTNGPFLHNPTLGLPRYSLTKSHCGGYCNDCLPKNYVHTVDSFEVACATGQKDGDEEGKMVPVKYSPSVPSKIVHLIRNPFSNLVSRLHLGVNKRQRKGTNTEELLATFTSDKEGLAAWCHYFDERFADDERNSPLLDQSMLRQYQDLPCRAEWFRYVQWHTLAIEVTKRRGLPVHTLYYEDYTSDYNGTVQQLFDFLELPILQEPLSFHAGKTYIDYYDPKDARKAAHFVRDMATPETWLLLRHYFTDWLDASELSPKQQLLSNDVVVADKTNRPAVVWLMSFPNSGTSYTITNTEHMSNVSTATNYAKGWDVAKPVRPELTNGPFLHQPDWEFPKGYVLTKTHCGGYCDECPASRYVLTVEKFQEKCTLGHKPVGDDAELVTYSADVPEKAVHLLRDPFDNIVARLHLALKKREREREWTAEQVSDFRTQEGFQAWCSFLDAKFDKTDQDSLLISKHVRKLMQDVPCRAEWFRYIQWHNLAIETTQRLNLPVHVLYYENYTSDYNATVTDLFSFLELSAVKEPRTFIPGKTYRDFFDLEQFRAAERLVRSMASADCWKLLKPYFANK